MQGCGHASDTQISPIESPVTKCTKKKVTIVADDEKMVLAKDPERYIADVLLIRDHLSDCLGIEVALETEDNPLTDLVSRAVIQKIEPGTPAAKVGNRLQVGDEIVALNRQSLIGKLSREACLKLFVRKQRYVRLTIARRQLCGDDGLAVDNSSTNASIVFIDSDSESR